ncbi:hypothetical protein NMG60_11020862 [Bertholletia excelsa]
MVLKQYFTHGDGVESEVLSRESKQRRTSAIVGGGMKELQFHEFVTQLEPLLRKVVKEEVEHKLQTFLHSFPRPPVNQCESSQPRGWLLHFDDKLPSTLFTGSRIESEDNKPVKIVLLDAITKQTITSGALSSIKVEIVVLDGDFGTNDLEDWSEKDFNANVVRERDGRRPLVTGDLTITLRDGVGCIGDVSFTDNSSWIRSRRFRLGARAVQSSSSELRIREARSDAFVVKDHRGESYKKHHPPNLDDDIWRLERIAKDGVFHKRLAGKGITTVKDFLQCYNVEPSSLRNILGGGISNKTWETILEHANNCVLDDNFYLYYGDAEKIGLIFNSVYTAIGVTFDCQNSLSLDKLNGYQMQGLVEKLRRHAYKNLNALVPLNDPSVFGPVILPEPFSSPSSSLQHVNFTVVQHGNTTSDVFQHHILFSDQEEMQLASSRMTSPPCTFDSQDRNGLEVSVSGHSYPMQVFAPTLYDSLIINDSCSGPSGEDKSWAPSGSVRKLLQNGCLAVYDNSQAGTSKWQGNGLFLSPSNDAGGLLSSNFGIHISRSGKPKARWCMIRAVVKWGISLRRDVAAKKWKNLMSGPMHDIPATGGMWGGSVSHNFMPAY